MIHKEGDHRHKRHGGAAILVYETILVKEMQLNTPLQAMAAQVTIEILITIVSLYNSKSHEINERLLFELKNQLPPPVLSAGDSDSYVTLLAAKEHQIVNFIENNNLNILNNGNATRISEVRNPQDLL